MGVDDGVNFEGSGGADLGVGICDLNGDLDTRLLLPSLLYVDEVRRVI